MYDLGFDASEDFPTYAFEWHKDKIIWFVDGKDTGAAGRTYTVKEATKSFTVQAKYILDGQTLAESETETVHVKDGLIDRIIAFLRRLFRRLPVVEQAYLGAQFREQ